MWYLPKTASGTKKEKSLKPWCTWMIGKIAGEANWRQELGSLIINHLTMVIYLSLTQTPK